MFYVVLGMVVIIVLISSGLLIYYLKVAKEETSTGANDVTILKTLYDKKDKAKDKKAIFKKVVDILTDIAIVLLSIFLLMGLVARFTNLTNTQLIAVGSASMSYKNEENSYLFDNHIDNQLQTNDLIGITKVDDIKDVELYDIVVYYPGSGRNLIHRVIEKHPTYLVTRGDANSGNDEVPVTNDNIVGVYNSFRLPYAGALVTFTQSYYGLLTFGGLTYLAIFYSVINLKLKKETEERKSLLIQYVKDKDFFIVTCKEGSLKKDGENVTIHLNEELNQVPTTITYKNGDEITLPQGELYHEVKTE